MELKVNDHFYDLFFDWDFDILLCIGGYGSGKSHEMFSKVACKIAQEQRRAVVVRKHYTTLRESCFEDLNEAIERVGVSNDFRPLVSPLSVLGKNGSKVIFKGLDDRRKIKSIKGIDLIVAEEANEIEIDLLKELINRLRSTDKRGHLILMTNPGLEGDSIAQLFFNEFGFKPEELYSKRQLSAVKTVKIGDTEETVKIKIHHSTYLDNIKNLPAMFIWNLENEKDDDLRTIAKEGRYGVTSATVFRRVRREKNVKDMLKKKQGLLFYNGLDFGYSLSYDCMAKCAIDKTENTLYIYDGFYQREMSVEALSENIYNIARGGEPITADCADSRLINELRRAGHKVIEAKKGQGSVNYGLRKLNTFTEIVIDEKLYNMVNEGNGIYRGIGNDFEGLARAKNRDGTISLTEFNIDPHGVDCVRYGIEEYKTFDYKNYDNKPQGW